MNSVSADLFIFTIFKSYCLCPAFSVLSSHSGLGLSSAPHLNWSTRVVCREGGMEGWGGWKDGRGGKRRLSEAFHGRKRAQPRLSVTGANGKETAGNGNRSGAPARF